MSKILALSEAVGIALHCAELIAINEKPLNANNLSELTKSSKHHIAKVMQRLVKAKLLTSTRGPKGGFYLEKQANKTTLLEIYEAIEGEVEIEKCPMNSKFCPWNYNCMLDDIGEKIANEFVNYMKSTTLQDLKDKMIT